MLKLVFHSHQRISLHQAAAGGHIDIVRYLVEKGANINTKNGNKVNE